MASTTNVASNAHPLSATSTSPQPNGAGRVTTKPQPSMKTSDGARKQTASPSETSHKRAPPQKAWTSAVNPITQKSITQPQQNGNIPQQKAALPAKAGSTRDGGSADRQAHDRLTFILAASTGLQITLSTSAGENYGGVLSGCTSAESGGTNITTKMTKRITSTSDAKANGVTDQGSSFTGSGPDYAMTFEGKDITEVSLPCFDVPEASKPQSATTRGFRTDADISRATEQTERPLQPWVPDSTGDAEMSLDSAGSAGWDQFEANQRLFGTSSTFDEHLYTTRIDRSAPSYKERERQAARVAREIEGTSSTNTHLREERGQVLEDDGEDEEDKYSGVQRDDRNFPPLQSRQANKYTPPARRAPTGQATVAGAPVDPAIISAQISRPETSNSTQVKAQNAKDTERVRSHAAEKLHKREPSPAVNPEPINRSEKKMVAQSGTGGSTVQAPDTESQPGPAAKSPQRQGPENATEDVENRLLHQFRAFAASEKMRVHQSKRTRANNDRHAKLRELQSFSQSFKLRTPVPTDLVGILAKDPTKQELIVEKARKEHREQPSPAKSASQTTPGTEAKVPAKQPPVPKFDPSMVPGPIPDRQTLARNRAAHPATAGRNERHTAPQAPQATRGGPGFAMHRATGLPHDRRPEPNQSIPPPIPIHEGRVPPLGPSAEQSSLSSPQRSSAHTPSSAISTKFNVKASEFKPNATAPTFTPAATSIAPSSPQPIEHVRSASGTSSPSSFFGSKKPRPATERPAFADYFDPFARMRAEVEQQKEQTKKAYPNNGGIPPAYNTPPRWDVAEEKQDRTYKDVFDKLAAPAASPAPSAPSMPAQHMPYQHQTPYHIQNGVQNVLHVHPSHHAVQHSQSPHQYIPYEDGHGRVPMAGSPQIYHSPRLGSGQMVYPSPMAQPPPMPYSQAAAQYIPAQAGPSSIHVRQFPGTLQYMHGQPTQMGAPMMGHQSSNGPFMGAPQQQYHQHMPLYSPSPAPAYPPVTMSQSHAGYPSPGRGAPMMMHQGSQQGHHNNGQHVYGMPAQPAHIGYGQYGQSATRGGNPAPHNSYGTSPGPAYHHPPQPQRAMSGGYAGAYQGKVPMQPMQPGHGPPAMNGAAPPGGYPPPDAASEMAK